MNAPRPKQSSGPIRPRQSLAVVDEAQNRLDAAAFMASQGLLQDGRVDEALSVLLPLSQSPVTTVQAHAAAVCAAVLVSVGRAAEALPILDGIPPKRVSVDRGFIEMVRAQALRALGRTAEAITAATAAVDADPCAERYVVLALCQRHNDDLAGAIASLERAHSVDVTDATVLGHLAAFLATAGQRERSDAAMERLTALKGDADPVWCQQVAFALACRGDVSAAQAALDRAQALDPAGTRAWFADDDALVKLGLTLSA